jgi:hypothetical protein
MDKNKCCQDDFSVKSVIKDSIDLTKDAVHEYWERRMDIKLAVSDAIRLSKQIRGTWEEILKKC